MAISKKWSDSVSEIGRTGLRKLGCEAGQDQGSSPPPWMAGCMSGVLTHMGDAEWAQACRQKRPRVQFGRVMFEGPSGRLRRRVWEQLGCQSRFREKVDYKWRCGVNKVEPSVGATRMGEVRSSWESVGDRIAPQTFCSLGVRSPLKS